MKKYVAGLEDKRLITTEPTKIELRDGRKRNGNLLYTIVPMHEVIQTYYARQFTKAELATAQHETKATAEKLGIEFVSARVVSRAHDSPCSPL